MSTTEEIEVYDELIADRPEFSFYSGVVLNVGPIVNLKSADMAVRKEFENEFHRQSLTWLVALAKVEVNATTSMYGNGENAFSWKGNSTVGMQEYYQVLLDDVAAHLVAINTDQHLKKVADIKKPIQKDTVPYLIRLRLISNMLSAIYETNNPELIRLVDPYMKETNDSIESIVTKIYVQTAPGQYQTRSFGKESGLSRVRFYSRNLTACMQNLEKRYSGDSGR